MTFIKKYRFALALSYFDYISDKMVHNSIDDLYQGCMFKHIYVTAIKESRTSVSIITSTREKGTNDLQGKFLYYIAIIYIQNFSFFFTINEI